MDRKTELDLIDELLALKESGSAFLDDAVARNPVERYASEPHFQREREHLFRKVPLAAAHISELPETGSFLRREIAGLPVLLTRDAAGDIHAFLNVCRHRGTRLVNEEAGCKHRFSCPYHAWTYANTGELIAAPHFDQGFPEHEKSDFSLKRLQARVRFGFVWVVTDMEAEVDVDAFFASVAPDLDALKIEELGIAAQHSETRAANWKILVEGGIEAYHFRVAHRSTIGPHFEDNLSSYRAFGAHLRSVLPRTSMAKLSAASRETWRMRDHANVLYTLFPSSSLLVQQDHIAWIMQEPISAGQTRLRLVTLAPRTALEDAAHWRQNHEITSMTLDEDFTIGESMQSTLSSGANENMLFGRFEGALDTFNQTVAAYVDAPYETVEQA